MNVFDLQAVLKLDKSNYDSGMKEASQTAQNTSKGVGAGTVAIGTIMGNALTKAANATVGFAKDSMSAGMNFESAMSQVAATSGKTMTELESNIVTVGNFTGSLVDFAKQEGSTTAFTATQAAEALNYMALAGYDAQTSVEMLPNVLNLAAAGSMDLASASDMVTDAQSALGLTIDGASTMVDQMAKASATTNTSVSQLGEAFLTVGGTAKSMKGGTAELAQVIGILSDNGIKGSEAGTHLRNIILSLSSPTDEASKTMEQLGLSLYDSEGNMRSMENVIGDLSTALDGMTDEEKTNAIASIFNKTDIKAVNALLGTNKGRWEEVAQAIEDSQGAAEQMANTQLDNLTGDVTLFQSALEGVQIIISEQLTPVLRKFVSFGTGALSTLTQGFSEGGLGGALNSLRQYIDEATESFRQQHPIINAVYEAFGFLIDNLNIIMPILAGVVSGIVAYNAITTAMEIQTKLATAAQTLFNAVMNANPFVIVVTAIGALVGALVYLYNTNETVRNAIDAAWSAIKTIFLTAWDAITNIISSALPVIQNLISTAFSAIKTTITTIMNAIKTVISTVWNVIATVITTVVNAIKTVVTTGFNAAKTTVTTVMNAVKTTITTIWTAIKTAVTTAVNGIKTAITTGFTAAKTTVTSIFDGIKTKISDVMDGAKTIVSGAIDKIKGFFNFSWSLPSLKLPHISIQGSFSLTPPSVPHFAISWYAKAMSGGMILDTPTIFGMKDGKFLGGGEAGAEVVVGKNSLLGMISASTGASVAGLNESMNGVSARLDYMQENLEETIKNAVDGIGLTWNKRQFGRLVSEVS